MISIVVAVVDMPNHSLVFTYTLGVAMKLLFYQFIFFISVFGKKIDSESRCGPDGYYSEAIGGGCLPCPDAPCDHQDYRDRERCKKACEKTTTKAPTSVSTTSKVTTKGDKTTLQIITTDAVILVRTTRTAPPLSPTQSAETTNSTCLRLAVSLGVLGTIVVCLLVLVSVYIAWRRRKNQSTASEEKSFDVETPECAETCSEASTSSQNQSPAMTKRSHSDICSSQDDGIRLPLPETDNLLPTTKDSHVSSLNLRENEN